ncbi:hypothetical protein V8F33_012722 [Rhypophila sp. PSN 637]
MTGFVDRSWFLWLVVMCWHVTFSVIESYGVDVTERQQSAALPFLCRFRTERNKTTLLEPKQKLDRDAMMVDGGVRKFTTSDNANRSRAGKARLLATSLPTFS